MKRLILLLLFTITNTLVFSQIENWLGRNFRQITYYYEKVLGEKVEQGVRSNGQPYILVTTEYHARLFIAEKGGNECLLIQLFPYEDDLVNSLILNLNQNYSKLNANKWQIQRDDGLFVTCKLFISEDGDKIFSYFYSK